MRSLAICNLVERGWRSARELSLALTRQQQWPVHHYIRGRAQPPVVMMMAHEPHTQVTIVPRVWFRCVAGVVLIAGIMSRRWGLIIVDNPRTAQWAGRWARWARVPLVEAEEHFQQLTYRWDGASLAGDAVVARLTSLAPSCAAR